jgi:hypothetical protein
MDGCAISDTFGLPQSLVLREGSITQDLRLKLKVKNIIQQVIWMVVLWIYMMGTISDTFGLP